MMDEDERGTRIGNDAQQWADENGWTMMRVKGVDSECTSVGGNEQNAQRWADGEDDQGCGWMEAAKPGLPAKNTKKTASPTLTQALISGFPGEWLT